MMADDRPRPYYDLAFDDRAVANRCAGVNHAATSKGTMSPDSHVVDSSEMSVEAVIDEIIAIVNRSR